MDVESVQPEGTFTSLIGWMLVCMTILTLAIAYTALSEHTSEAKDGVTDFVVVYCK